ncbi:hypothetical protein BgramDRAFT_1183 [Paraburkholderia graminis C4D1M]|uniref:Uncharacterized protein n=1 Tax=Paraburkholderia graminis (strain ATCC 700544 / DSM 17151 / LMG 18924 / NCIMB 13744 / C4D1M) TaxID=396598 RepID=B1FVN8_PARG4|nr:hypothetical protein BgramDRAFT_1183 [Paraburkholderia graminis C4D1M]
MRGFIENAANQFVAPVQLMFECKAPQSTFGGKARIGRFVIVDEVLREHVVK